MTSKKEQIHLIGEFSYNDKQVLKQVVNQISTEMDIDPVILEEWLNHEKLEEVLEKQDRNCYLKTFKGAYPSLEALLEVSHSESFINDSMPWEREKCGHIIDEFSNGYIQYCNKHRYLHQVPESLTERKNMVTKHIFVEKKPSEIMDELIFRCRFDLYLRWTRDLAKLMEGEFYRWLKGADQKNYTEEYITYSQEIGEQLVEWLREHPRSFRGRYPSYQEDKEDESSVRIKMMIHPEDSSAVEFFL